MNSTSLPAVIVVLLFTAAISGQFFASVFQYDRELIAQGQLWRIISCHFVHTNWHHLVINAIGATLVATMFRSCGSLRYWVIGGIGCAVGISLGFLLLMPTLDWYRGCSGLLHGFLMMGILTEIRAGKHVYWLGVVLICVKLAGEYLAGPWGFLTAYIGASVITEAHALGAASGVLIAWLMPLTGIKPGRFIRPGYQRVL